MKYEIRDTSQMLTPSLAIFSETLQKNLDETLRIAGDPARLRPHCKTHKMEEVAKMQLDAGIVKHKCATFAEAEMLANVGITDILLAYNLVGPNIQRAVHFRQAFPQIRFCVTADHVVPVQQLSDAMESGGTTVDVILDVDSGQHRTGLSTKEDALEVYKLIHEAPGTSAAGFHLYDGQNHQTDLEERRAAVLECWQLAKSLREFLQDNQLPVDEIVCGGTGSFPIYAELDDPAISLSPGTTAFFDVGYGTLFPDLAFEPAARVVTRVISRPTANRLTLDAGYKACASDPPADRRLRFPDLPDAQIVLQNEEHLVLESAEAQRFQPGDILIAIPWHICPTSNLHQFAYVVTDGAITDKWKVASRDRLLTI